MARLFTLALLLLTCFAVPARAEEQPVMAGDLLAVNVTGEDELSGRYMVDPDGSIAVPMIGAVRVQGLMPAQVRDELTKRLAKFVRNPQVRVEFLERAQITVGFTGAVGKPGRVKLKKGARLLDGLAEAQGLAPDADMQKVSLQRRGKTTAETIDLAKLPAGDAKTNPELLDGDVVVVPRLPVNTVRVLGAVVNPGAIQRKDGITILDLVLAGGGLTPTADRKRAQLLRRGKAGPEPVNLDDVFSGKAPNAALADGDTLTIPAEATETVKVFGMVVKPGEQAMRPGSTVLEAITGAGGFEKEADRRAIVLTDRDGAPRRLSLDQVDSPDGAIRLEEGSRLYVPRAAPRRFAVMGGVHQPGLFPFPDDPKEKVYLTDALAQAKGPVMRAKLKQVVVVQRDANGEPAPVTIDAKRLLENKDPQLNLEIHENDVVYVEAADKPRNRRSPLESVFGFARYLFRLGR